MSLRILPTAAAEAYDHYGNALIVGVYVVFACIYIATQLEFEDALPAGYMLFVLVAAMGIFLPDDYPMRVRMTAFLIVLVAGVSAAVALGLVVGCVLGMMHWFELVISTPPFLLAVLLLRVACRQLRNKVDELERKYYTLDDEHDRRDVIACPVCGFKDEPKANQELWTPFWDIRLLMYTRHVPSQHVQIKRAMPLDLQVRKGRGAAAQQGRGAAAQQ